MRLAKKSSNSPVETLARLTLRQRRLLGLLASGPRSPDGLRAELYGSNGTRLTSTESRNITASLAVLVSRGFASTQADGSFVITTRGRKCLDAP